MGYTTCSLITKKSNVIGRPKDLAKMVPFGSIFLLGLIVDYVESFAVCSVSMAMSSSHRAVSFFSIASMMSRWRR